MRLLYLYPEEWTGRRAREVHTLSTCAALAREGVDVTLVTAGGGAELREHFKQIGGDASVRLVPLSRSLGPLRITGLFLHRFEFWLQREKPFEAAYIIHLKAAATLRRAELPYLYEAHEVFVETPQRDQEQRERLHDLERDVLMGATWRVATSKALAKALRAHYVLPDDFAVVPNAGDAPLPRSIASVDGPFVYCGSIADWKGLDLIIEAARKEKLPLRIVGGSNKEWTRVKGRLPADHVSWRSRVELKDLPGALAECRAGLIPTQLQTPAGRYSCPMKLFDYARCGLPVLTTPLPSLESLNIGSWCTRVEKPTAEAWGEAMQTFLYRPVQGETARAWAEAHTWDHRAETLLKVFARKLKSAGR